MIEMYFALINKHWSRKSSVRWTDGRKNCTTNLYLGLSTADPSGSCRSEHCHQTICHCRSGSPRAGKVSSRKNNVAISPKNGTRFFCVTKKQILLQKGHSRDEATTTITPITTMAATTTTTTTRALTASMAAPTTTTTTAAIIDSPPRPCSHSEA